MNPKVGTPLSRNEMRNFTGGASTIQADGEFCFQCSNGSRITCEASQCGKMLASACNQTGCTCVTCS